MNTITLTLEMPLIAGQHRDRNELEGMFFRERSTAGRRKRSSVDTERSIHSIGCDTMFERAMTVTLHVWQINDRRLRICASLDMFNA